jgi:DNA-binding transcriptional LysR family regulator
VLGKGAHLALEPLFLRVHLSLECMVTRWDLRTRPVRQQERARQDQRLYPVSPARVGAPQGASEEARRPRGTQAHSDLSVDQVLGFATWATWLEAAGVTGVDTRRGLRINNSAAALQAAIEGQGVALARSIMARDDIAAGRLVRLFPSIHFASTLAYFVGVPGRVCRAAEAGRVSRVARRRGRELSLTSD